MRLGLSFLFYSSLTCLGAVCVGVSAVVVSSAINSRLYALLSAVSCMEATSRPSARKQWLQTTLSSTAVPRLPIEGLAGLIITSSAERHWFSSSTILLPLHVFRPEWDISSGPSAHESPLTTHKQQHLLRPIHMTAPLLYHAIYYNQPRMTSLPQGIYQACIDSLCPELLRRRCPDGLVPPGLSRHPEDSTMPLPPESSPYKASPS